MDTGALEGGAQTIARPPSIFNFEEFVRTLQVDRTEHLHRAVAEAETIQETSFFRDRKLFDVLRETVLPRLIGANSAGKKLRIWSAATSTGQEAYSIAMLLREHFAELVNWDVKIVGTDLSRGAIDYARRGRYRRSEVNRGLPVRKLVKYLARYGEEWEIAPALKSMCEFRCAGLCGPLLKQSAFDLVLLRNVLLYLPAERRSEVFRRVYRQMVPGGYLVLGAAEQAEDSTDLFHAESSREYYFYRPA
jgi:chemotaxis protein methyltransferase CheR